jgi:ABC-type lipoprotein release transport system permease subunit
MRTLFLFVGLLTLAATAFTVFASTSALIAANARPLAMQLALGMPKRFLSRLLWLHSLVLWGAAAALAGLLAALIWIAVAAGAPATAALHTLGPEFYWGTFAAAAGLILLTSWLSTKYSFFRWLQGARSRLSRILQSGS